MSFFKMPAPELPMLKRPLLRMFMASCPQATQVCLSHLSHHTDRQHKYVYHIFLITLTGISDVSITSLWSQWQATVMCLSHLYDHNDRQQICHIFMITMTGNRYVYHNFMITLTGNRYVYHIFMITLTGNRDMSITSWSHWQATEICLSHHDHTDRQQRYVYHIMITLTGQRYVYHIILITLTCKRYWIIHHS